MSTIPESASREVHHYLIVDTGTQWTSQIARIEMRWWHETPKKGPSIRREEVVSEELTDILGVNGPFVANLCARETAFMNRQFKGIGYGGWAISPAEYERVKRLVELKPAHEEYQKLAAYNV